jgi:L-iditol 2-dehydrogenase
MRVAVYYNNRDIRLEERPRPKAGPGELLVRIEASGVCGSDVMEWYRLPKAPIVLGHEVAGVVEEVGEGVTRFAAGDRVVTTHHVPCNACRYCLTDRHSVCDTLRTTHFDPGGFSEYVLLPAINVERGTFHLPDHVSYEEGSFVEPLACVVRAQRLAGIVPGRSVAVLGSGISGILHIQLARALGAGPIVATDVSDHRLESARRYGAAHAVRADEDVPAGVREGNAGRRTVVLYAPADPGVTYGFPLLEIWENGTNVVHSYAGPPADMRSALDLIATGRLDVASMVTHRLGLAETGVGFGLVLEGGDSLKVIVEPQR